MRGTETVILMTLIYVTLNKAWPMLTAYGTSKFAIRGLTQNAGVLFLKIRRVYFYIRSSEALDLGKYGITVNAYAPG